MFYKNNSVVTKTFYGVTFKPGEIKEVPGYITYKNFEFVAAPKQLPKEPHKVKQSTKSIELIEVPKTHVPKVESVVEPVKNQSKRKRKRNNPNPIDLISTQVEPTTVVESTEELSSEETKSVENTITKEENA